MLCSVNYASYRPRAFGKIFLAFRSSSSSALHSAGQSPSSFGSQSMRDQSQTSNGIRDPFAPKPFGYPTHFGNRTERSMFWNEKLNHISICNQSDIALTITKHIFTTEAKESNFVFSPILIQVMLSVIAAGAKGPTLEQLLAFLKSKTSDQLVSLFSEILAAVFHEGSRIGGPHLSFANGVWVDKSFSLKQSFKHVAETAYKTDLYEVDFQNKAVEARNEVNAWVEKVTNGLIKDILPEGSVTKITRLILANALYFKGVWNKKFDSSFTKEHDFYLLNGSTVRVPFMTSQKDQFVSAFDDFKVLKLPYNQGKDERRFSMYIFLPDAKDGLSVLMERMSTESSFLDRHLPMSCVKVGDFRIPKFKISFGLEASKALKGLGLALPFTIKGGLTEMVENYYSISEKLYVSNIFHKAFIEVNEEGTEATAATMTMASCARPDFFKKIDFVADHPFLFVIREDFTGVILFIGCVLEPNKEN